MNFKHATTHFYRESKVGSIEYLDKCRSEREREEEIKLLEEERLQKIINFCEKYNENFLLPPTSHSFPKIDERDTKESNNNSIAKQNETDDEIKEKSDIASSLYKQPQETNEEVITNGSTNSLNDENDESSSSTLRNTDAKGSSDTLNALYFEKALLQGELDEMKNRPLSVTEDEELCEFQKIEREIKYAEVMKCLTTVEEQILSRSTCSASTSNNNMLEQEEEELYSSLKAPLAEAETSDDSGGETIDGDAIENYNAYEMLMFQTTKKKKSSSLPPNELYSVKSRNNMLHQRSLTLLNSSANQTTHDENGLLTHLQSLGHDLNLYKDFLQVTCCTCSGYLWKLCSKSENRWKKRFWHFDRHYRVLFYYKSIRQFKKVKKPNGGVYFDDIRDVYIDRARTKRKLDMSSKSLTSTIRRHSEGRCVFVVDTSNRQFVLSTFVWEVMRMWVDVIFTGAESYFD